MSLQTFYLPFDVPLLPVKMLSAGTLKCMYENGNLRYIYSGEKEVVRMIYSAVRDENWETASYVISDEVIEESEGSFTIKYNSFYQLNQIHYKAAFTIEGKDNTLSFSMKGEALNSFQANRVGICVLHPIEECAGKKVLIKQKAVNRELADSSSVWLEEAGLREAESSYTGTFPVLVSPHQPFKQVQQMQWLFEDGVEATLIFEGDIFETEDQRNWTDASYKTYSRPLELPSPIWVSEGETMEQKITLKVTGDKEISELSVPQSLSTDEIKVLFPKIGYCRRKSFKPLTETEINLLQKVPFDHYRLELHLDETDWQEELSIALSEAKKLSAKLELVVFFQRIIEKELKELIEKLQNEQQYITSILVLHKKQKVTPHELLKQIYPVLKAALPDVKCGYGTDGHFADLNRNRPQISDYDFVSFSISPQVHAVDTRSLIENLNAQADTIKTALTFTGNKAIHISPVTLKNRTSSDSAKDIDPRQHTWLTAHWTLQTIKNLSGAGNITFFETTGPKGIIKKNEALSAETEQLAEALLTPVYKVLAAIKAFQPEWIIKESGNNKSTNTFLLENKTGERLLFITEDQEVVKAGMHIS